MSSLISSHSYFKTTQVFVAVMALFFISVLLLSSILVPIIISFTIYSFLQPFTNWLIRKNIKSAYAIIISLLLMVVTSVIALLYAFPRLFDQILKLQQRLPDMLAIIEKYAGIASQKVTEFTGFELDLPELALSALGQSYSIGNSAVMTISDQLISIAIASILIPFITYFLLKDFRQFRNNMMNWLPNAHFELGWLIYQRVTNQLQAYTRGVLLQSFIMSCVSAIGFTLIGLDIPVLMGIVTGLLNLIPYIGPLISIIISILVALGMTPFDPSLLYLVVIVIVTAQLVDNFFVIPYFIANAVDLHPIMVILGVIIFGNLFGMVGVILAIPAIAAAKILFNNLYNNIQNSYKHHNF